MYQIQPIFITLLGTMLITLECVLLALQAVAAVRLALHPPVGIVSQSNNRLSKRSSVVLGGDITKCYTMKVNVHGINLDLRVDSSVFDIVVPLPSSSNNVGSTPESISSGKPVTIRYKSRKYKGFSFDTDVTIPGTRITGINLPVIAVKKQSASLVGIGGNPDQGVFGIGYSSLSDHHSRVTAIDALYNGGVIPNNEIGLQLCPYKMLSKSSINIGNMDVTPKCGTDGKSVAWVDSPTNDQFTVNIKSILVNGEKVDLPKEFQKHILKNGHTLYSYLQTCFVYMYFPRVVVETLVAAIVGSDAITVKKTKSKHKHKLSKTEIKKIFWENRLILKSKLSINWDRMPTISITMFAENPVTDDNRNSVVTIKLGPRDYLQRVNSKEFRFIVEAGPNENAALGIPFMNRLRLVFDRQNKRIGLGPGCGCEAVTDGYPTISNADQVLWPLPQLPKQPSGSSSGDTSTLRRSFSRFGSTLRDSIRRSSRRSKPNYEKLDG
ncbi:hypothetical protein BATDEDRAFT_27292 [Batrachochytrium dendrobatidis JAM81]|uniref:Peptidase A1 domain-containing protein n=1 Tax=Batrachochytrium dendrobatidis (strain JAM81 / FGSC 10211) TaxID=684364 RepID=F4PAE2_BATDJ|nr:uncharacterized protein BATDEDRAFT_27292 [Batrachochytrium dendrobatidis JAM81]EGF77527.1 hypothetical protein BATDEDRAFT_27292 [Batrachochytrium dendrobatidis JAM81]|eukprot:XP_006681636.1 hypothetical protein BATDEDRAFT_27292 [Batrachochytrium dendrobatidis JAM81]